MLVPQCLMKYIHAQWEGNVIHVNIIASKNVLRVVYGRVISSVEYSLILQKLKHINKIREKNSLQFASLRNKIILLLSAEKAFLFCDLVLQHRIFFLLTSFQISNSSQIMLPVSHTSSE